MNTVAERGASGYGLSRLFLSPSNHLPEQLLKEQYPILSWNLPPSGRRRILGKEKVRKMEYVDSGIVGEENKKPTVILLPGAFTNLDAMRPDVLAISESGFRTIALDYAGAGNLDRFVATLPAFLDEQKVHGDVILYGTSLGGVIAQHVSLHPSFSDRVTGMILSHTARPDSKANFANITYLGLSALRLIEKNIQWDVIKGMIDKQNAKGGVRKFSPGGGDLAELDEKIALSLLRLSDQQRGDLTRDRARGFLEFSLGVTKGARSLRRKDSLTPSEIPTLWISTDKDPVMLPEHPDEIKKFYPNTTCCNFPAKYEHHTILFRRGTMLTDHIIPFVEKYNV